MFSNKLNRVVTTKDGLHDYTMYNTVKSEDMVKYNIFLSKVVGIGIEQLRHSFADLYSREIAERKSNDAYALEYVGVLDIIAAIVALGKRGIKRSCYTITIRDGEVINTIEREPNTDGNAIQVWDEFIVLDYVDAESYRIACDVLLGGKESKDVKDDFLEFCDKIGNQLVIEDVSTKTTRISIRDLLRYPERYLNNLSLFHEYAEGAKYHG